MRDSGNPNSRFADTLKRIGISLLRLFRGDFPVFLLFLAITFFFWWSQTMNQDYDTAFRIPVKVTGIPENVRVLNNLSDHITLSLNGKGTALRKSARRASHHVVNVSNSLFNMNQENTVIDFIAKQFNGGHKDGTDRRSMGTISLEAYYNQRMTALGSDAETMDSKVKAQDEVLIQVDEWRKSVSAVNWNEELTNMIMFQQGYSACSRCLTTMDEMLDRLINSTGTVGR